MDAASVFQLIRPSSFFIKFVNVAVPVCKVEGTSSGVEAETNFFIVSKRLNLFEF